MSKKRAAKITKTKDEVKSGKHPYLIPALLFSSIALLTAIVYIRSLHAPLIFDDRLYINSSRLKSILPYLSLRVRSISEFSFAVNYHFWGLNLVAFRITNIIFHIITGGLAFYLAYMTLNLQKNISSRHARVPLSGIHFLKKKNMDSRLPTGQAGLRGNDEIISEAKNARISDSKTPLYTALFVAAVFLLHPIQTSAVNYITQRMAIMACMFSFAGLIFYTKGVINTGVRMILYYILSAVSLALAIFSKENAVMVLFMLPVYDFFFLSSFQWREFRKRFAILIILMLSLASLTAHKMGAVGFIRKIIFLFANPNQPLASFGWTGADINWTPVEYLLTELRVVSKYILLILFPVPSFMSFDYSNAYPVSKGLLSPATTLLALLFLISLLSFSIRTVRKAPLICFGIIWYLLTISLESFIALGLDPYFEHRNYLPGFGLFLALASIPAYIGKFRIGVRKEAVISVIVLILSVLTFMRNGVWRTEELLWKDSLSKSPTNARALTQLSYIYIMERRFKEAEEYLEKASGLQSLTNRFRVDILINQAALYREMNRRQDVLSILKKLDADDSLPDKMRGYVDFLMGDFLREEGELTRSKTYLERAYRSRKNDYQLVVVLGFVSRSLGETDKAEGYFKEAIRIDPAGIMAYLELGDLYLSGKDTARAEMSYREAIRKGARGNMAIRAVSGLRRIAEARKKSALAEGR